MPRPGFSLGVRIACVALAGTAGAMGMLGQRRGGMAEIFAAGGHLLASGLSRSAAAAMGLVIHIAWMIAWSFVLAALAQRDRRPNASLLAVGVAALALAVTFIVPASIGGPQATLQTAERVLVHVVLAISLIIGMRLAPRG